MTTTENTTRPSEPTITRRKMLKQVAALSIGAIPGVALTGNALSSSPRTGDDRLLALVEEWRVVADAEAEAWAFSRPLAEAALREWKKTGLPLEGNWERYMELHTRTGATEAEAKATGIGEHEAKLVEMIRETAPTTAIGLAAKFEVLRALFVVEDVAPRIDQDWAVEFFNAFSDDLRAMAGAARLVARPKTEQGALIEPDEIEHHSMSHSSADVQGMIRNHQAAYAKYEELLDANDWGRGVTSEQVSDALGPVNDALEAICRARPMNSHAAKLRREYLSARLLDYTDGCPALIQCMYDAFLA